MKTNTLEVWKVAKALREKYAGIYRYGFNGKENDKDWGTKWVQDYGFRLYNPSIGKFLSVDPLTSSYPWYTPYQFAGNKPIWAIDLDGLEEYYSSTGEFVKYGEDKNSNEIFVEGQSGTVMLHQLLKIQTENKFTLKRKLQTIISNQRINKIYKGEVDFALRPIGILGASVDRGEDPGDLYVSLQINPNYIEHAISSESDKSLITLSLLLAHEYLHFFQRVDKRAGAKLNDYNKGKVMREIQAHHLVLFPNSSQSLNPTDFKAGKSNTFQELDTRSKAFYVHQALGYITRLKPDEVISAKAYVKDIKELQKELEKEGYKFPKPVGSTTKNHVNFKKANSDKFPKKDENKSKKQDEDKSKN